MTRLARHPARLRCAAAAITLLCFAAPAHAASKSGADSDHDFLLSSTPPGFDDLAKPREILVDVYFGGRKVGDAVAVARPGFLQFRDARSVASLVPSVSSPLDLANALAGDLPTHSDLVCSQSNEQNCGKLETATPGIIFDEGLFRVDLFVPPSMLQPVPVTEQKYLPGPPGSLSLTSSMGLALSGAEGASTTYNFQDRTIVALGSGRVRTDASYASTLGLVVDDFVGELDRRERRYSAGLFWAPGLDLTGRRRIAGVGVGTQFDTRADRDSLTGTPLLLFLTQPARVEFLIDGRLVGSRSYDAGNNILDTSGLPEGAYPLVLRIRGADGSTREERRFFAKTPQVAPVGEPLYFAYAGFLANTRPDRAISLSDTFYYQLGTARRLTRQVAADLSLVGTQQKGMVEAGLWFLTPIAQVRAAGLVSTKGDNGFLLQGTSQGQSRINFAFDLRRVWTHDDQPLIPQPAYIDSFGSGQPTAAQLGGTYTQASGTVGYRFGTAYLAFVGSLRKDAGHPSDYSFGPSLTWPMFNRNGLAVTLQAEAHRTRTTTAGFAGIRILYSTKRLSVTGTAGHASLDSSDSSSQSASRFVGGLSANYFYEDESRSQISAGAGLERSLDTTVAHAGGTVYSRYGNARADLLESIEGSGGLQYGLTLQSAVAMGDREAAFGSRDLDDSAIIVAVDGNSDATFQVLVNDRPFGRLHAGGQLPIHLEPYRSYDVRIRPAGAAAVTVDGMSQRITLYPGTVRVARWSVHSYFTAFGQAIGPDGRPIANAMIEAPRSIGETDENGYFQIDVSSGDRVAVSGDRTRCHFVVGGGKPQNDLVSLGKVTCR